MIFLYAVVIIGLSSMTYQVTEGPNAVATVCATIQLGSVGKDVAVNLTTQVTGEVITGIDLQIYLVRISVTFLLHSCTSH